MTPSNAPQPRRAACIAAASLLALAGCVEDYNPNAFGTPPGTNNGATTSTNNATTSTNNATTSTNNATTSTNNATTSINNATTLPPQGDPALLGFWREDAQRDCSVEPAAWVSAKTPIQELVFYDDLTFQLTWFAFETYVDYWGTYGVNPADAVLVMRVSDGNYIPEGLDLEGTYRVDARGRLELYDMWLGAPEGATRTVECGHRFEPY